MASKSRTETLFLIDAYALIFQVFHAIREMTSPKGVPTNALFGFTRDLLYLHQERAPDYLVCVFDGEKPTFREQIYAEYKAHRSAMPEELRVQLAPIRQLLAAMRIPVLIEEGFEADDVIATVSCRAAEQGLEVFICTSDKDCRQLLTNKVKMYNLRKRQVFDCGSLKEDWGITPEQVVDLQTLVGDPVDNVPGVPGIGLKTAAKLLQEYQTLDNLLARLGELPKNKRRENLEKSAETLNISRRLVRLECAVPMKMEWEAWRRQPLDVPRLLELFREWGFHRFADQVLEGAGELPFGAPEVEDGLFPPPAATAGPRPGHSIFVEKPAGVPWEAHYQLVDTPASLTNLLKKLEKAPRLAIDLETTSENPLVAELVGIALSLQAGEAFYLPVQGPPGSRILDTTEVLAQLRPVLENPAIAKINQNIKYDLLVLRQHNIELRGVTSDPMIADYLLNAGERRHNLQYLARNYLQHDVIPITDLIGKKGPKQLRMHEVDPARVVEYAGEDAAVAWRLCALLEPKLAQEQLKQLYEEVEIPLIEVLAELEHNGIRVDVERLRKLSQELGAQMAKIEGQIFAIAGEEFNIASLKQLRTILFDRLKLPVHHKTDRGDPSTDQETLEWLAAEKKSPLARLLLEQRRLSKLKGTYVDTFPELVLPRTQRLHASFHQTVAATGRLSSSDPNLQNIPVRSDLGGQIRQAFLPAEGWTLLTADYSQIELRLLAHFAQDPVLLQAFAEDRDIHTLVAAQIYGIAEDQVTPDMRRMAKTVNFGVLYGMSAYGLAQRLQITKEEASRFIETYFARYPNVLAYQDRLLARCRQTGHVSTLLGRRRSFEGEVIRSASTYQQRNQAEREAINMEIQGSAADLIKVAMLRIHRRLKAERWQTRMLLQIHDELVFESPPAELETAARMIEQEMTQALASCLHVPLKVDIGAGENWLDIRSLSV